MLVQPATGFAFVEFCKFWKTWFWHDLASLFRVDAIVGFLKGSIFVSWFFGIVAAFSDACDDIDLLWYNSGVGGVVLMYQPHWGDSVPLEPTILLSPGVYRPPYGLVGTINPLPAVRGFMFGMYLDVPGVDLSCSERPCESCWVDLDFRIADLVGFWKLPVAALNGLIVWSWCGMLCSLPMISKRFQQANVKANEWCEWVAGTTRDTICWKQKHHGGWLIYSHSRAAALDGWKWIEPPESISILRWKFELVSWIFCFNLVTRKTLRTEKAFFWHLDPIRTTDFIRVCRHFRHFGFESIKSKIAEQYFFTSFAWRWKVPTQQFRRPFPKRVFGLLGRPSSQGLNFIDRERYHGMPPSANIPINHHPSIICLSTVVRLLAYLVVFVN